MLPGLRFLFAAVVLSMSLVVFGLGAAALLRASHDRFVSTHKTRSAPPPMFAQHEPATAALTMLRVDAPEPAPAAIDAAITVATATSATPPSPAEAPLATEVAAITPVDATEAMIAPPADAPSITSAVAPAPVEASPLLSTAANGSPEAAIPAPDQPVAAAAANGAGSATELAAISEAVAVPVPPKLPMARPVIKNTPAIVQRVVKKRKQIVRQRAPTPEQQPFGAPSSGG